MESDHVFSIGDTVVVSGLGYPFDGTHVITGITTTDITFTVAGDDVVSDSVYGTAEEERALFLGLRVVFATAGTFYLDQIQVTATNSVDPNNFHEARAVEMYFAPTKTNYLENPSFIESGDMDDVDWAYDGVDSVAYVSPTTVPGVLDSSEMVEITTTGVDTMNVHSHTYAVAPGAYYTFSVYAKTDANTEPLTFGIQVTDAAGTVLTDSNGNNIESSFTPYGGVTSTWARYATTVFVPQSSTEVRLLVYISGETTGNIVSLDAAQVEKGYAPTDYFDGSYVTRGAFWLGDVNDSESMLYANLGTKMGRLQAEISNYLPINTPYVITIGDPANKTLESSGFSS
jgi:hypothetical protein